MAIGIDYKLDKLIKEIQTEIKEELGEDLDYATVAQMVNQQVKSTVAGMSRGDTVVWKYFGSYVATQRRVDMLNKRYEKIGKKPTLLDRGFYRVSLDRKGQVTNEGTFEPGHRFDMLPGLRKEEEEKEDEQSEN